MEEAVSLDSIDTTEEVTIWRTFEDGYVVRSMRLSETHIPVKWFLDKIITKEELQICWKLFSKGPGLYIGEYDGKIVASLLRLPWGNSIYSGGYYYVAMEYRSKGFGIRIRDEVGLVHVGKNILSIDSVIGPTSVKNVEKYGYKYRFDTLRLLGTAKTSGNKYAGSKIKIDPAHQVGFDDVIKYDNKWFVSRDFLQRRELLKEFIEQKDSASFAAFDNDNNISGFGFCRPTVHNDYYYIGPLYADSLDIAIELMKRILNDIPDKKYFLCIYEPNENAKELVKWFGMEEEYRFHRQHINGDACELKDGVYSFTSLSMCVF